MTGRTSWEKQMQKRTLGNSGLEVSAPGYGCMGLQAGLNSRPEHVKEVAAD
jgi:aryl-alcohol dehydrogenase-like predicted oxidoreductase